MGRTSWGHLGAEARMDRQALSQRWALSEPRTAAGSARCPEGDTEEGSECPVPGVCEQCGRPRLLPAPAPCLASPRLPPPRCSGVCVRKSEWVRPGRGGRAGPGRGPGPDPCRERRPEGSAPRRGVSCPWGLHPQHGPRMGGVGAGPPHVASCTQGSQTASCAPSLALLEAPVTLAAGNPGANYLNGPGASWRLGSRLLQRL